MNLTLLESCDSCGACCQIMIVPPFVINAQRNEPQERGVPQALVADFLPTWEVRWHLPESPCSWYDAETARCRYYEFRPQACRDFEINSPSCHACREQKGIDA